MFASRLFNRFIYKRPSNVLKCNLCSVEDHPTDQLLSKTVWISQSDNVYVNLALEEWLFKNGDFKNQNILLLWKNSPCVVVGRHQNPWLECNKSLTRKLDIDIARRGSGGGAVYHDTGNLCLTFFTDRNGYDRQENLKMTKGLLESQWPLKISLNCRDDLLLNEIYKISGSAARLERDKAYHHFTLMIDVNKENLNKLLKSDMNGFESKATESVKSDVINLADQNPDISLSKVIDIISLGYVGNSPSEASIKKIDPINELQSEISPYLMQFKSSDWIFSKTPNFVIKQEYSVVGTNIHVTLNVEKGLIKRLLFTNPEMRSEYFNLMNDLDVISYEFRGVPFQQSDLDAVCYSLRELTERSEADIELDAGVAIEMKSLIVFFQIFDNILTNS